MSNRSKRAKHFAALGGGALIAAPMFTSGVAHAASFEVTNTSDSGAGSLRQAIENANTTSGADTITFAASATGTITLATPLTISEDVNIVGPGANVLTVSGDDSVRPFYIPLYDEDVTISGITITAGNSGGSNGGAISVNGSGLYFSQLVLDDVVISNSEGNYGGGVYVNSRIDLLVTDSTITGNTGTYGGGIYFSDESYGSLTIEDSVISNNDGGSGGGGLYFSSDTPLVITRTTFENNTADFGGGAMIAVTEIDPTVGDNLTITDSTFSGNSSTDGNGGGLYLGVNQGATATITGTTISNNTSSKRGGAIHLAGLTDSTVSIENSTFSGNTALYGGGIYVTGLYDTELFTISHSTITGNSSTAENPRYNGGGGIYLYNGSWSSPGDVVLDHTVIAGNTSVLPGNDISINKGRIVGSWSMVGDLDTFTLSGTNNLPEGDAMLGALANNGGLTKTHLPLAGSPLLDAGDPAFASPPSTDQRGQARVAYGRIDIGAVEVGALPPTGSSSGLLTGLGAALLALGGAMHLGGRRRTQQS